MRKKKKPIAARRRNSRNGVDDFVILQRVAQRINSILDLDVLLEEIVDDVARTFGCSRSGVLLIDEESNELVIAAVRGWTVNYHVKGDRFKIGDEGMVGHVASTGETHYAPDVTKDPYYMVSESSTRSEIDIPLRAHGRLIGVFNAQTNKRNAFPPKRRQLLEALAGHIGTAIENARLFDREREQKNRMAKELEQARQIQESLFPRDRPEMGGFDISGICLPCTEVGGDWFDFIPLRDGRLVVVLADVSGKGMGAALLMSSSRAMLRLLAETEQQPGDVLSKVNGILVRDLPKHNFVTLVYVVLDPASRTIVLANAGHPQPLLVSSSVRFLETDTGFPLGLFDAPYPQQTFEMPEGSSLVIYSDGIAEAVDSTGEQYGQRRLRDYAAAGGVAAEALLEDVRRFSGGRPPADDMTAVVVRVK